MDGRARAKGGTKCDGRWRDGDVIRRWDEGEERELESERVGWVWEGVDEGIIADGSP